MGVDMFVAFEFLLPYLRAGLLLLQIVDILDKTLPVATAGGLPLHTMVEIIFTIGITRCALTLPDIVLGFGALIALKWYVNKQKRSSWFVEKLLFIHLLQAAAWALQTFWGNPYAHYYK